MSVTRRQAREWAVQMLTAADLNPPEDIAAFMADFWNQVVSLAPEDGGVSKVPEKYKSFTEERVTGVLRSIVEIDAILAPLLANWELDRLGTVERAVLRMGIWELKNTDVPKAVVINEAVDIVNWFSAPMARRIVNGVLDKYAKSLGVPKEEGPRF